MFVLSRALSVALLASCVVCGPLPRAMTVHEERTSVPSGFTDKGNAPADTTVDLRIGLMGKDMAGLEKALFAVSEPDSAQYGEHLSIDEVKAFAAPTPETVSAVTQWLSENGIIGVKTTGAFDDWLTFSVPVSKANSLLNADFKSFLHGATGTTLTRSLSYSLPSDLLDHIEVVHPVTAFVKPRLGRPIPKMSAPVPLSSSNVTGRALPAPASCATTITPACLEALYGIPSTRATQSSNRLGVSGFIEQFAQTADLRSFLTSLRPDLPSTTTFALQTLDGGTNTQGAANAGIEANLDIEYTVGVASGVPVTFISVGENNGDGLDGFLDIINFLLGESSPPQVLTTSYGFDETDVSSTLANRLCNAYMSLGARGTSILFASGDGGVSGGQSQSCTTFIPAFPGGCPFHTSVGATHGTNPEVAATFSSGGFSNVFARPSYQASAVSAYLTALGSTNSGRFNPNGRAFPDVSAQGQNVEIVSGGSAGTVAGTSCSSPIFASVISLINDRLIAAGRPVLGFLNPFLYANPSMFFDITSGNNPGCGTNGFPARAGWDPVTGLGTPNFAAMLSAAGL